MHPWKQFLNFLLVVQASNAFTVQKRSTLLPVPGADSFQAATFNGRNLLSNNFTFRRKGPVHSSTTAHQDESDLQSPPSVVENVQSEQANTSNDDSGTTTNPPMRGLPWSNVQDWALRDNLPKYVRHLPGETTTTSPKTYALWRTMLQDVPELSGYPIDFLQTKFASQPLSSSSNSEASSKNTATKLDRVPGMLPYLDNFYFEPSGGLSGQVYGVPGLRDGTVIETSPVGQVEVTIPLGYVLTEDIGIAYEIGSPLQSDQGVVGSDGAVYSLSGVTRKAGQAAGSVSQVAASNMAAMARQASSRANGSSTENDEANAMLVQLGASTGLLLAGATAMNMLSHHLTVNVFWV